MSVKMDAPDVGAPGWSGWIDQARREGAVQSGETELCQPWIETESVLAKKTAADAKRLANLAAGLALAGFELHAVATGFAVRRWGREVLAPDLNAVADFSRRAGVQL